MHEQIHNREKLLLAARALFLEQGYEASVDAIVGRAGVARQTFYNHFKNKESLFAETAKDCFRDIIVPLEGEPEDLRASLKTFAQAYRNEALSAEGVAAYRTVCSQSPRFPELVREAYEQGFGRMISRLAAFLDKAMARGYLRRVDSTFAAELLAAMALGQERTKRLFGLACEPTDEAAKLDDVIDGFLRMLAIP
ncbi:MAG: TetR/AcrR family transcriptional regulator [Azonexus sp.]|jgi:TetR/AcrR family transcriptional repressor of mexJK operon|nr:TetR/AcrR family transcriptional regulator [Azonexus sp.]